MHDDISTALYDVGIAITPIAAAAAAPATAPAAAKAISFAITDFFYFDSFLNLTGNCYCSNSYSCWCCSSIFFAVSATAGDAISKELHQLLHQRLHQRLHQLLLKQ
jgi:hypothetical protein